jgi:hypothetical protein
LEQSVINRVVTVAGGRFAPGHLGELTQIVPFEMVDAVLAETGTVQRRVRDLPSRVVVYLLLAGALFEGLGYRQVWQRLVAGLGGVVVSGPCASALLQARRRVGVKPLRALFDLLRSPGVVAGVRWRGLLVVAVDGTIMSAPDSPANLTWLPKQAGNHGGSGYPLVRVTALVACGTRTIIDAVFGPFTTGEIAYAQRLLCSLRRGMIVLGDRNFDTVALYAPIVAAAADLLIRVKSNRRLPVLGRYDDGSYLSLIGTIRVRMVECEISVVTTAGRRTGVYRLATTLLDHRRYPALDLVKLYHERWEIETCYLEIKSTILGGRVLRARTVCGVTQEIYALLIVYQILRIAIADAVSHTGADPDRASFTIALNTARDQLIQAANVIADTAVDTVGVIGRHVLANLMPDRRLRINPRVVKRAISKYVSKTPVPERASHKATLSIHILTPPRTLTTNPRN